MDFNVQVVEPRSFKEVVVNEEWKASMDKEYSNLITNETWTLTDRPTNANVIKCGWVYKAKKNEFGKIVRFKSRSVANGYNQVPGLDYDETFAPVGLRTTIRLFIVMTTMKGYHCE
jgi:hypothetical protein